MEHRDVAVMELKYLAREFRNIYIVAVGETKKIEKVLKS
jgi:hypothetical protein